MDGAKFAEYKETRYEAEKKWYDDKSVTNRRWDRFTTLVIVVCAATVPLLVLIPPCAANYGRILAACLSAAVSIVAGLRGTFKFHELYVNYRTVAETLKKEAHYFDAAVGPYQGVTDREGFFVQHVESMISRENTLWQEIAERRTSENQILGSPRRPVSPGDQ